MRNLHQKFLQANHKILRGTSDHSPATWINSITIPIIKNPMRIPQSSFNPHQSLHYTNHRNQIKHTSWRHNTLKASIKTPFLISGTSSHLQSLHLLRKANRLQSSKSKGTRRPKPLPHSFLAFPLENRQKGNAIKPVYCKWGRRWGSAMAEVVIIWFLGRRFIFWQSKKESCSVFCVV